MSTAKKATGDKLNRQTSAVSGEQFVRELVTRGEAVPKARKTKAPPGVTHWLVEEQGKASVKRVRFSTK